MYRATLKMIELTEIMRRKGDQLFTELLNRFRTGTQTEADIQCIQSRSISPSDSSNYPHDALHIGAENQPVNVYNVTRLNQIPAQQCILTATDQYPPHVSKQDIDRVLARSSSKTGTPELVIAFKLFSSTEIGGALSLWHETLGRKVSFSKPVRFFLIQYSNTHI